MIRVKMLTVGLAALAVALLGLVSIASANPATVGAGSATVEPGAKANIAITVTPAGTEKVGSIEFTIATSNLVTATGPFSENGVVDMLKGTGVCNFNESPAKCAVASTAALTGDIISIEFTAGSTEGTSPVTVAVTNCSDTTGAALTCTASSGSITIATPTPTPTPVPATATPTTAPTATPTPKSLPQTGGAPTDGSSSSMAWLVGSLGLAVLAAGVWAVSRTRRQSL